MRYIGPDEVARELSYPALVDALGACFRHNDCLIPARQVYQNAAPGEAAQNYLVLMPAWDLNRDIGIKVATLFPGNAAHGQPSVQASYLLLDGVTGAPRACLDATELTNRRTAAASALASRFLSRPEARRLCVIGTGGLAPYMIAAHAAVRGLETVEVWGRSFDKARMLCERAAFAGDLDPTRPVDVRPVRDLEAAVRAADIVTCATTASSPPLHGAWLRPGTHVDLVGGFTPTMQEADEEVMRRGRIFADSREAVLREAGDLIIPISRGVIGEDALLGDLTGLAGGTVPGRLNADDITVFKSVGLAVEDLVAARLVVKRTA